VNTPPTPDGDRAESRDSVLFEFIDPAIDFTPRPAREETLRHAPSWLRERALTEPAKLNDPTALADCLLAQARVLLTLRRAQEALPRVTEAEQLYQQVSAIPAVADCYHVAAMIHESLGEPDKAFDLLRREEELRRRSAA
jgi:hypothetical protein